MASDSSSPPTLPSAVESPAPEGGADRGAVPGQTGAQGSGAAPNPAGGTEVLALDKLIVPCSGCGSPLPPGAVRCRQCGSVFGEMHRCPHCRVVADVDPSQRFRFVCRVCGKPRVPNEDPTLAHIGHPELEALRLADRHSAAGTRWKVAAILISLLGTVASLVLALIVTLAANGLLGAAALGTAVLPLALALLAAHRSRTHLADTARMLETAWGQAALEVARLRRGAIDARSFAQMTRIDEAEAERVLMRVSAQSQLAGHVVQDGTLRYRLLDSSSHASSPYETKRTDPA